MMSENKVKEKENVTRLVCPENVNNSIPDSVSHTLSVPLYDPDTAFFPSRVMPHLRTCVMSTIIFKLWWWERKGEDYLIGVPLQCQQFNPRLHVPHLECIITWSWHNFLPILSDGTRVHLCVLLLTIIFELWWWVRTKVHGNEKRGLPDWCALAVSTIRSQIPCPTPWVFYHMILTQLSSRLEWWHMW